MDRIGEDLLLGARLHQIAQVQHADAVGDVLDHAQIVGDKEIGAAALLLDVLHEVDHLGLNGHVQRGDALVRDDELRVHDQRPGDAHTLPLSAGKLVGITGGVFGREAHFFQQLRNELGPLLAVRGAVVDVQALADDVLHLFAGVQTGHGILEDHLHVRPEHLPRGAVQAAADLLALETHAAGGGIIEADDAAADGGLAGAGLPHQAVGLAGIDVEGYPVDSLDGIGTGDGKMLDQVFHLQQGFTHRYSSTSFLARSSRACSSGGSSTLGASGCSSQVAAKWVSLIL